MNCDLANKVRNLLLPDEGPGQFVGAKSVLPGQSLSDRELDVRDWGMVYGIAYGIARGEDPYEPVESVGERAISAAVAAFRDWNGKTPVGCMTETREES